MSRSTSSTKAENKNCFSNFPSLSKLSIPRYCQSCWRSDIDSHANLMLEVSSQNCWSGEFSFLPFHTNDVFW